LYRALKSSFVVRANRNAPVAVSIATDLDLPGVIANGAVLDERLARRSALVDVHLARFAAVWATHLEVLSHGCS
jgi:hypothetical protein